MRAVLNHAPADAVLAQNTFNPSARNSPFGGNQCIAMQISGLSAAGFRNPHVAN
jgi:hypothetical protein